jgi:hypothetical protein
LNRLSAAGYQALGGFGSRDGLRADGIDERYENPISGRSNLVGFGSDKRNADVFGLIVKPFREQRRLKKAVRTLLFGSGLAVGSDELIKSGGRQGLVEGFRGRLERGGLPGPIDRVVENENGGQYGHETGTYQGGLDLVAH